MDYTCVDVNKLLTTRQSKYLLGRSDMCQICTDQIFRLTGFNSKAGVSRWCSIPVNSGFIYFLTPKSST